MATQRLTVRAPSTSASTSASASATPAARQQRGRADVLEHARVTSRALRVADTTTVEDHPQAEIAPCVRWQVAAQLRFHLHGIVELGQAEPPAEAPDVG